MEPSKIFYLLASTFLTAATVTTAQDLNTVSPCIQSCITDTLQSSDCGDNLTCLCYHQDTIAAAVGCVRDQCSTTELGEINAFYEDKCWGF
ncbi:hypothetical protein VTN00DRAFT_8801 [Thermoascus crustaceus]|uniref:uncharacterized protein n=1 Tax=Thermoascus crustaceus TaxID=5088 RepID=UPI0037424D79